MDINYFTRIDLHGGRLHPDEVDTGEPEEVDTEHTSRCTATDPPTFRS